MGEEIRTFLSEVRTRLVDFYIISYTFLSPHIPTRLHPFGSVKSDSGKYEY